MAWYLTLWDHELAFVQWGVVIGASLLAGFTDLRTRRIPNRLTGPLLLTGFIWAGWIGGFAGIADAFVACFMLGLPYFILFAVAGGGAGDAKMMGAIGTWLGTLGGLATLTAVALAGGVLAVGWAIWQRRAGALAANMLFLTRGWMLAAATRNRIPAPDAVPQPAAPMPYGLAICAGTFIAATGAWLWTL